LLQLFYCTNVDCPAEHWEPFNDGTRVRIVEPDGPPRPVEPPDSADDFPAKTITSWERFDDYPHGEEHGLIWGGQPSRVECPELGLVIEDVPVNVVEQVVLDRCQQGDKLAGWPFWVQSVEYPNCPCCGRRMRHVVQVDSQNNLPFMFGDSGCGHITQCPEHLDILAFGWACC
jgi:hypothetical protein